MNFERAGIKKTLRVGIWDRVWIENEEAGIKILFSEGNYSVEDFSDYILRHCTEEEINSPIIVLTRQMISLIEGWKLNENCLSKLHSGSISQIENGKEIWFIGLDFIGHGSGYDAISAHSDKFLIRSIKESLILDGKEDILLKFREVNLYGNN